METLEEVFKRLSFKTIELEGATLEDEITEYTLFEMLIYYEPCENLIIGKNTTFSIFGRKELAKYIEKVAVMNLK
jgi:hypothetical protein